jgi:general secretion pathway protein N
MMHTHYRSALILGTAACLLAVICLVLWRSDNDEVIWPEPASLPAENAPVSAVSPPNTHPLTAYSAIWKQPLFTPSRQPDLTALASLSAVAPSLDDVVVTGIVVTGSTRIVLFKQGEQRLKVKEGNELPNGWKVAMIGARQVQLSYGNQSETLWLLGNKLRP